jgi:hypothetical protein
MKKFVALIVILFTFKFAIGQNFKKLEFALVKDFPASSVADGRWVYNSESATIQKIDKPEVNKLIPNFSFYKVRLTNFLGYHVNPSNCLVLFDSTKFKTLLAVPMWYSDISENFLKLFIGAKFSDSTSIMKFTLELQDLMILGSTGQFENTKYNTNKITFEFTHPGSNEKEVWRQLEILIPDNTIKGFISTNPKMNTSVKVE